MPIRLLSAPPFAFSWTVGFEGTYTVTALATARDGRMQASAPATITVTGGGGAPGETIVYLHNDAAGNPIAATDAAGAVIWRERFAPFGERLDHAAAAAGNRQWFHGKGQDAETGLLYFGARYYDPTLGRFLSIDPAAWKDGDIHGLNRYVFANNNPYRFTDPDGAQVLPLHVPSGGGGGIPGFAVASPLPPNPGRSAELARIYDQPGFDGSASVPALPSFEIPSASERGRFYANAGFPGLVLGALDYIINAVTAGGGAKPENISSRDAARIQSAADRTGATITVVGGRARGTAKADADWDYVVEGVKRNKVKNLLPEGARGLGEPRNVDFHNAPVDRDLPHITFTPERR
jgi:RHS repeat-associated protein